MTYSGQVLENPISRERIPFREIAAVRATTAARLAARRGSSVPVNETRSAHSEPYQLVTEKEVA